MSSVWKFLGVVLLTASHQVDAMVTAGAGGSDYLRTDQRLAEAGSGFCNSSCENYLGVAGGLS